MISSKSFFEEIYPIHKIVEKNIMQFKQEQNEPFWRYFEQFKDLLANAPIMV